MPRIGVSVLAAAIATLALGACLAAAATTPWMLGDETTTACYTLDTLEDIPLPAGLDMQWVLPLPGALDSSAPYLAEYAVTVDDAVFWSDAGNVARLGADHARWRQLCNASATANNTGCSDANKAACCVFHSNLHSCRQSTGSACEPWVTPRNATATDAPAACGSNATTDAPAATATAAAEPTVLVTHTAAQVGAVGPYVQRLQLPAGSWVTIAHVKIMNFQCAVGALRRSVDPENAQAADRGQVVTIAAGVSVAAVVLPLLLAAAYALRQRQQKAAAIARCPTDEASPFTASFIGVKNEAELREHYDEAAVRGAFRRLAEIVSCAARETSCHEARQVNEATILIVAKHPLQALDFSARAVETAVLNEDWSVYFSASTLQKTQCRKVADNESDAQTVSSIGTAKSAADPSATTASVVSDGTHQGKAGIDHPVVAVNVGVAFGFGSIAHNRDTGAVTYHGDVVDRAAVAADIADAGEIVVSAALVDSLSEEGAEPDGRFAPLSIANHEGDLERHSLYVPSALDLGGGAKTAIVPSVNAAAKHKGRTPRSSRNHHKGRNPGLKKGSASASGGGISAALARAELGVSRRRCAVVVIDVAALVPPATVNARTARKLQAAHAKLVATVAERSAKSAESCKCTIVSLAGSRITAVVNVVGDALASNPLTRACHFALLLQAELAEVIAEAPEAADDASQHGHSPGCEPLTPTAPGSKRSVAGGITIGVAAGEAACGEIGGLVAVVGSVTDRAALAQAAAAALVVPLLVATPLTQAVEDPALAHFVTAAVDVAAVTKGFDASSGATDARQATATPSAIVSPKASTQPHVPSSPARASSPPLISAATNDAPSPSAPPRRALQLVQLVAVVSERPAVDSEWMYTMRDAANDHDGAWPAMLANPAQTPTAAAERTVSNSSFASPTAAASKSVSSYANISWSTMPPATPVAGPAGPTGSSPTSDSLGTSLPMLNASSLAESVAIRKLTELRALNRERLAHAAASPSLMQYAAGRTLHFTCAHDLVVAAAAGASSSDAVIAPVPSSSSEALPPAAQEA